MKSRFGVGITRRIVRLYKSGASLREIGSLYDVSHTTIAHILDDAGVQRRGSFRRLANGIIDLNGQRFGRLRVLYRDGKRYPVRWIVLCDCGKVKSVRSANLRNGKSRSCGCSQRIKRRRNE